MTSTMQELFAQDPLTYTKTGGELQLIVQKLRESRHQFNAGNKAAGNLKKTEPKTDTGKAAAKLDAQLSLKDLGIDL